MLASDDEPVPLHAGERVGHRRLLDVEAIEQLLLRQAFLGPKFEQNRKLTGCETKLLAALVKRARKALSQQAGQIGRRFHTIEGHAYRYARSVMKTSYNAGDEPWEALSSLRFERTLSKALVPSKKPSRRGGGAVTVS
ncbi:hypothetical protein D9M70_507080 [compost metagenome]